MRVEERLSPTGQQLSRQLSVNTRRVLSVVSEHILDAPITAGHVLLCERQMVREEEPVLIVLAQRAEMCRVLENAPRLEVELGGELRQSAVLDVELWTALWLLQRGQLPQPLYIDRDALVDWAAHLVLCNVLGDLLLLIAEFNVQHPWLQELERHIFVLAAVAVIPYSSATRMDQVLVFASRYGPEKTAPLVVKTGVGHEALSRLIARSSHLSKAMIAYYVLTDDTKSDVPEHKTFETRKFLEALMNCKSLYFHALEDVKVVEMQVQEEDKQELKRDIECFNSGSASQLLVQPETPRERKVKLYMSMLPNIKSKRELQLATTYFEKIKHVPQSLFGDLAHCFETLLVLAR